MTLLSRDIGPVHAYKETSNHQYLTRRAVELANRGGSYPELERYLGKIVNGVLDEDETPRFVNHFYNPTDGKGLPRNMLTMLFAGETPKPVESRIRYPTALAWARDGMPDDQDWEGAIASYSYTHASRQKAYEALGHVIHLLQDMAQPDHARCRPHPGSYFREEALNQVWMPESVVDAIFPPDRVGFEKLWDLNNEKWPNGETVRKPVSLKEAFDTVARESQRAEDENGLLKPGEVALGLGSLKVDNVLLKAGGPTPAGAVPLELAKLHGLWTGANYARFRDNHWLKYELNLPAFPTIPWPATDETKPYLKLGEKMLPLAEEHSAGLMQHFHDIVNPPPFVQRVQIIQEDETRYLKAWDDRSSGERVPARVGRAEGPGTLKPNVEAEVIITFGPYLRVLGQDVREAVENVHIWLEPSGAGQGAGPAAGATEIAGSFRDAAGGESAQVWAGRFVPQRGGTLCILARDGDDHFEGRGHPGDALDSRPETAAHAGHKAPYEWDAYEPGPDRNHTFRLEGECQEGLFGAELLKSMRAGTWSGTLTARWQGVENGKPYLLEETKVTVSFRSLVNQPPWYRHLPVGSITFGNGNGTFESRWRNDDDDPLLRGSGPVGVHGSLFLTFPMGVEEGYKYAIDVTLVDENPENRPPPADVRAAAKGIACKDGRLTGRSEEVPGEPGSFYRVAWEFGFTPGDPPPHVTLGDALPRDVGITAFNNYVREAVITLTPATVKLLKAGKTREGLALQRSLEEATQYQLAQGPELGDLWNRIQDSYRELTRLWLSEKPNADTEGEYRQRLEPYRGLIQSFIGKQKEIQAKYVAATEKAATAAQKLSPEVAVKLRRMSAKLRKQGPEAFGASSAPK